MYRVIDSIKGRRIVFLHAAAALPLEADIKFWPRLALVHMHIKRHKASHLCVTRDSDGVEVWRAGSGGGVSIAAAIEVWLQQQTETEAFMLVLPLDQRVYFAKVEDGLVVSEQALVEGRALEVVAELVTNVATLPVRALDTGAHLCRLLDDALSVEELPFAVDEARFEPAWLALLKRKMPHQMMLLPPLLFVAMAGLYMNLSPAQEVLDETINTIKPAIVASEAAFSAPAALRAIANLMRRDVIKALAVAELTTLDLEGRDIVLSGKAANFQPPAAIAKRYGGSFEIIPGGWRVRLRDVFPEHKRPLSSLSDIQVIERIIAAAKSVLGESKIAGVSSGRNLKLTIMEVKITSPSAAHLRRLARDLEALPVRVDHAECGFSPWVVTSCRMTLEVKTK